MSRGKGNATLWTEAFTQEFCALTSSEEIQRVLLGPSGLLGWHNQAGAPKSLKLSDYARLAFSAPEQRAAEYAANMSKHQVYRALEREPLFVEARTVFRRKTQRRDPGLYGEPLAEFRFAGIVARVLGIHADHPIVKPHMPTRRAMQGAARQVGRLLSTISSHNVRLEDWLEHTHLVSLLKGLHAQLTFDLRDGAPRKSRADDWSSQRYWIDGVIGILADTFGEASPRIVAPIAQLLGFDIDDTVIDRRTRAVRARKERQERRRLAVIQART